MRRQATFAGILGELFELLRDGWREVALYTLTIGGATAVGILAGLTTAPESALDVGFGLDDRANPAGTLFEFGLLAASLVAYYFLLKRLLHMRGPPRSAGNRFWPYVGMSILSFLALILGLIVLIVPGIILLVRWSAASGYVIDRGQGVTESLSASWHATSGHSWAIFFAGIVLFLVLIVVSAVVGGIAGAIHPPSVDAVAAFLEAATSAVFSALGIAIYHLVQDDAERLREIFE